MIDNNKIDEFLKRVNHRTKDKITRQGLIDLIDKVANIHKNKSFGYLTQDDIYGQVWVICLTQLERYDPGKGAGNTTINSIERWLNKVVRNRLANFHRDQYSSVNEVHRQSRLNIINCLPIDIVNTSSLKTKIENPNFTDGLIFEELKDFVVLRLNEIDPTGELLLIFESCLNQDNVSAYYKGKLSKEVLKIMQEWQEMHNDG